MKKIHLFQCTCYALMSLMVSCTSEDVVQTNEAKRIVMTAEDFQCSSDSRTNLTLGEKVKFTWAETDTVGIFPNTGRQVDFPMAKGAGTNSASFDGRGWALKQSSRYMAYYPMQGKFYLDKTCIPVSFEGQAQYGRKSHKHIGAYDYMAAVATTPDKGTVKFKFEHLASLIELNIVLPKADTLTSIFLSSDVPFFTTQATLDLTQDVPALKAVTTTNKFELPVQARTTSAKDTVKAYFMMAPIQLEGKNITLRLANGDGEFEGTIAGQNFEAGLAYKFQVELQETIPSRWVDLGLSVKWAAYNLGAEKPAQTGSHFAWGALEPALSYTELACPTWEKDLSSIAADPLYDAATAQWGTARMPTKAEMDELLALPSVWTVKGGVNGRLITAENGNSIFLPAAGYYTGDQYNDKGKAGRYWVAEPSTSNQKAYSIIVAQKQLRSAENYRCDGETIRPVRK